MEFLLGFEILKEKMISKRMNDKREKAYLILLIGSWHAQSWCEKAFVVGIHQRLYYPAHTHNKGSSWKKKERKGKDYITTSISRSKRTLKIYFIRTLPKKKGLSSDYPHKRYNSQLPTRLPNAHSEEKNLNDPIQRLVLFDLPWRGQNPWPKMLDRRVLGSIVSRVEIGQ